MRAVLAAKRYWIGPLLAVVCLYTAMHVGPILTFVLTMLAIGLLFEVCTAWWGKNGSTGTLNDYRQ